MMKRCRLGNGETECVLCGEVFRFYTRGQRRCAECAKMTWDAIKWTFGIQGWILGHVKGQLHGQLHYWGTAS